MLLTPFLRPHTEWELSALGTSLQTGTVRGKKKKKKMRRSLTIISHSRMEVRRMLMAFHPNQANKVKIGANRWL